jgi:hypothetical protein
MRRFTRGFVVATVTVGFMLATSVPFAQAALDQTPPSLTVPVAPSFVVGNIVETTYNGDPNSCAGFAGFTLNIEQLIKWSATDDVAVSSYDLYVIPVGAAPFPFLQYTTDTQHTFLMSDDNDGDCGGGALATRGFWVTARDASFNATTKVIDMSHRPVVNQEDNTSTTNTSGELSYTGTWGQSNCTCFLRGHTAFTTRSGARVMFTRTYEGGDHVALVMAKGPGRGRASIRIDGNWLMDIDTYAPVNTNRVVVFERMMSAGTHTLTIVNHATPGRSRIDLDAVMTN